MSEAATPAPDPDVAMLARLAALDMASVEHVHARLMAATDAGEINDLGRTQERFARSLRRTLALKARLAQEAARRAERRALADDAGDDGFDTPADARIADLQDALVRVGHAHGLRGEPTQFYERLDVEIGDWAEREDFADADLDAQVRWLCGRLGLPARLAAAWRDLPHPDEAPPPWAKFEPAAPRDTTRAEDDAEAAPPHESSA